MLALPSMGGGVLRTEKGRDHRGRQKNRLVNEIRLRTKGMVYHEERD